MRKISAPPIGHFLFPGATDATWLQPSARGLNKHACQVQRIKYTDPYLGLS